MRSNRKFLWIAFVFLLVGVDVAIYYLIEILRLPTTARPADFYTACGELLLVAVLGIEGLIAVLHLSQARSDAQEEKRRNLKEATDAIFQEWWSDDMTRLRFFFYQEFLPKHWTGLQRSSLKEVEHKISDDGKIRRLTGFFDRVGWLGAAGLIDVDFVLGPMQHAMRRVWFATERLIMKEREIGRLERLDPVYRLGFEWLFRRSEQLGKHQAELLASRFQEPALMTPDSAQTLRRAIEQDEERFRNHLQELLTKNEEVEC